MVGVTARLPLKHQADGLEDEKVEDCQVHVKLVLVLVVHAAGQVEIAVTRVWAGVTAGWHGVFFFLMFLLFGCFFLSSSLDGGLGDDGVWVGVGEEVAKTARGY